jgi:hypothetical protein
MSDYLNGEQIITMAHRHDRNVRGVWASMLPDNRYCVSTQDSFLVYLIQDGRPVYICNISQPPHGFKQIQ